MDTIFSLDDIKPVQVTNIQIISLIVQMHSVVSSGFSETEFCHENHSFILRYPITGDIRLLHHYDKSTGFIIAKAYDFQSRIRKYCIVYNYTIQCQTQNIIMFQ